MLKDRMSLFRKLEMLLDVALATIAFNLCYPYADHMEVLLGFLVIWIALLHVQGMYESFRIKQFSDVLLSIWSSACLGVGIFGSAAYLLKFEHLSRLFVVFIFFATAVLTSVEKLAAM